MFKREECERIFHLEFVCLCVSMCVCIWQSIQDRVTVVRWKTTIPSRLVYIFHRYKQLNKESKTTDGMKVVCAHVSARLRCGQAFNEYLISIQSCTKTVSIQSQGLDFVFSISQLVFTEFLLFAQHYHKEQKKHSSEIHLE